MSSSVSLEYLNLLVGNGTIGMTAEGGLYQTFINGTGLISVKGTIVTVSTLLDNAVTIAPANSKFPIGVIYESGIAIGLPVKVVTYGKAQILLKDGQPAVRGYWAGVSDVAGRMYQIANPGDSGEHNREVGHSLESNIFGTNVLSLVQIHFN